MTVYTPRRINGILSPGLSIARVRYFPQNHSNGSLLGEKGFDGSESLVVVSSAVVTPNPSGISVIPLIDMVRTGSVSVDIKSHKASPRLTPRKRIMRKCTTAWLAWQEHPIVSLAA